jgi:hypothetical protein
MPRGDAGVSDVAKGASVVVGTEALREELARFRSDFKQCTRWMMIINVSSILGCAGLVLLIVQLI